MNEFCKHSEKIQVLSTYSQFEIGLYQLYTILDILYFFYTVFLHVFSHESHRCLKAFIFHKQHRGLEILIIPKQLTLEMATHQGDSVIHALVCISKGKKKKACLFSDTQENFACGWIWRNNQSRTTHIQAEATSHSGEVVD